MIKIEQIRKEISFYSALAKDHSTPRLSKLLIVGAIAYLASPIDLIPDFIPIIGHIDDLVVVPLLLWLALILIPSKIKRRVRNKQVSQA